MATQVGFPIFMCRVEASTTDPAIMYYTLVKSYKEARALIANIINTRYPTNSQMVRKKLATDAVSMTVLRGEAFRFMHSDGTVTGFWAQVEDPETKLNIPDCHFF